MKINIKNLIKKFFSYTAWNNFLSVYQYYKFSFFRIYSSRGSIDKKLVELLNNRKNGFFLEVGAYNGISESVSLRLETEYNWKGILIEPNPIHFKFLKKNRGKNICLNYICLNQQKINQKMYIKNLNQMSYLVNENDNFELNSYPINKINTLARESMSGDFEKFACEVQTLKDILESQNIKKIDLAIIDVEGSEIDLLDGIDFDNVDIDLFCIETYNFKKLDIFMHNKNYIFVKKLHKEDYVYRKIRN
jgi:FkbM family methyltransferase